MTYTSDKLYNEVIKRRMGHLASIVKVREIVPHLPCLTLTDREEIEAKRDITGNYNAMVLLLDCLRRRENWAEEFIDALRACDQETLANEISDSYDTIKGTNPRRSAPVVVPAAPAHPPPPPPPPPPAAAASVPGPVHVPPAAAGPAAASAATVTTATIHDTPRSTPPLLTPSSVEPPAPAAAPSQNHPPPQSLHSVTAPAPAEAPATVSAPAPAEAPATVSAPAPAEAPATVSAPAAPAPPPREAAQPSEPSAPVSIPHARPSFPVSAPKVTAEQNKVSFNPGATSTLNSSDDSTLTAVSEAPTIPAASLPTNTVTSSPCQPNTPLTSSHPPAVSEESKLPLPVTESSTSMKQPIQDTSPPEKVLIQGSNIISAANQVMETTVVPTVESQNSPGQTASPERAQVSPSAINDAAAGHLSQTAVADVEYFSKPGTLMGPEPSLDSFDDLQISRPPTETTGSPLVQPARPAPLSSHLQPGEQLEEPCSVTSDELMFSNATARITGSSLTQASQHSSAVNTEVPTEPVSVSHHIAPENIVPHPTPEENSFREGEASFSHNQPVEDHYESYSQSEPGTLVNVGQVYEEPSILNLNGQPPSMIGNAVHTNDYPESLKHTSTTESSDQAIVSEDQPSVFYQGVAQRNEIHASEEAAPAADDSAEPSTPTCQAPGLNASGLINTPQSQQREDAKESQGVLSQIQADPRLIAAAAAVGVAAVVMAWKLKH